MKLNDDEIKNQAYQIAREKGLYKEDDLHAAYLVFLAGMKYCLDIQTKKETA